MAGQAHHSKQLVTHCLAKQVLTSFKVDMYIVRYHDPLQINILQKYR